MQNSGSIRWRKFSYSGTKEICHMFFFFAFGVWSLASAYTAWRLVGPLALGTGGIFLTVLCVLVFISLPFWYWRFSRTHEASRASQVLSWTTYLGMGALNYLFLLLLLRDTLWLATLLLSKFVSIVHGQSFLAALPPAVSELSWWQATNLVIVGLAGLVVSYGVYQARKLPDIVEVSIPIAGLPAALAGLRLVQISDLHVGATIRREFVQRVVARVRTLQPDIIAFTGDVADGSVAHLRAHVAPLAELAAPHGKFFVTGNHEYYSGAESWTNEMQRLGFTVLLNQNRAVEFQGCKVLLAGVTDFSATHIMPQHKSDPAQALAQEAHCDLKILLAHQPRSVFAAARSGCDLQLSGHTHGGQFLPWNWLVPLQQPYVAGLFKHQNTWLYVSRGTGYWGPPLRIGAPSEITLVTLTSN
jgi:predicted MPP superfamily phosphohydrolase